MKTIIKLDIDKCLLSLLGSHSLVREWWESPNKQWSGRRPLEVYHGTEDDRQSVISYVFSHIDGSYQ